MEFELKKTVSLKEHNYKNNQDPYLVIVNWVYNQVNYITESIESILEQKTNFPVKIIIHDDASTDGTREIILEYQKKYPNLFSNILQNQNQYSKNIDITSIPLKIFNKNKYIALTHGDDYWTDPYKLQKQVDFLENNTNYSICFTNVKHLKNNELIDSAIDSTLGGSVGYTTDIHGYLNPFLFYTTTCVFRNVIDFNKLKKNKNFKDIFLFSMLLEVGDLYLINQVTAVYRIHEGGIWSMKSKFNKILNNTITLGEMVKYHRYKIPSFNEAYLWSLIQIFYSSEATLKQKIGVSFNFLKVCFRKPSYFKLFKKDFLRIS
jgi:glycosyltransferase involved in cell wall biosynthesis